MDYNMTLTITQIYQSTSQQILIKIRYNRKLKFFSICYCLNPKISDENNIYNLRLHQYNFQFVRPLLLQLLVFK